MPLGIALSNIQQVSWCGYYHIPTPPPPCTHIKQRIQKIPWLVKLNKKNGKLRVDKNRSWRAIYMELRQQRALRWPKARQMSSWNFPSPTARDDLLQMPSLVLKYDGSVNVKAVWRPTWRKAILDRPWGLRRLRLPDLFRQRAYSHLPLTPRNISGTKFC
jgi:hypothetical protein